MRDNFSDEIAELIRRAQEGNSQSFEALYKRYYERILNYIMWAGGVSKGDAEDICEKVFTHVWQNIKHFECEEGGESGQG